MGDLDSENIPERIVRKYTPPQGTPVYEVKWPGCDETTHMEEGVTKRG